MQAWSHATVPANPFNLHSAGEEEEHVERFINSEVRSWAGVGRRPTLRWKLHVHYITSSHASLLCMDNYVAIRRLVRWQPQEPKCY